MATWAPAAPNLHEGRTSQSSRVRERLFAPILVSALTLFAVAVHGYHPYAEDGGLYLAGVKHLLDPSLFPADRAFVTAHLHYSLFAPTLAGAVRLLHLPLDVVVLLSFVLSFAATLSAAWLLAGELFPERRERVAAVMLLACWMTIPIAGTSLMLMDPYVTARSVSTPAVLLLIAGALRLTHWRPGSVVSWRTAARIIFGFLLAAAYHPLMAAYGLACALLLLALAERPSRRLLRSGRVAAALLGTFAFLVAFAVHRVAPLESMAYTRVALTRSYWFLSEWRWFEIFGLVAPLLILGVTTRRSPDPARRTLARTGLAAGLCSITIALCFSHVSEPIYAVARLQPLRVFQLIYIIMVLFLGSALSRWLLRGHIWRYPVAAVLLGTPLFAADQSNCSTSPHVELGWSAGHLGAPHNPWVEAFGWIRTHTPKSTLIALDADYIAQEGEDAQSFRAIAERSSLPDAAKDGGEASITPALAEDWLRAQTAQDHLSGATDAERVARLRPLGVTVVALTSRSATAFPCEYNNGTVKVCRLP